MGSRANDTDDRIDTAMLRVAEDRHLGQRVPDVEVLTEEGTRRLSALIAEQPTILLLAYYTCNHTCPVAVENLQKINIDASESDYRVVVLSFDVADTLETMNHVRASLDHIPDNWTFGLLAEGANRQLTESVGFNFFFSERDQIFVHPSVLVFLSPEGEVMRYLYGTDLRARDIELALIESRNREPHLNEIIDMVALTCFQFDATGSRYVLHPALILGAAGIGVLGICGVATVAYSKDSIGES